MTNFAPEELEPKNNCFCIACDRKLKDRGGVAEQPCPYCGAQGWAARATASAHASAEVKADAHALYDRTGRAFGGDERDVMVDHVTWSDGTRDEMTASPYAARFRASLDGIPMFSDSVVCFRAITHVPVGGVATVDDCGPAPAHKAGAGRYSRAGAPVLYLSESIEGVRAELKGLAGPLWIQRLVLPAGLPIADFSKLDAKHPANQAFWFAEIKNRDARLPEEYVFGQVVAELVRTRFPFGMRIPGTRPCLAPYCNIVIFDYSPWRSWLDGVPTLDAP
jgi:hypothetical protein